MDAHREIVDGLMENGALELVKFGPEIYMFSVADLCQSNCCLGTVSGKHWDVGGSQEHCHICVGIFAGSFPPTNTWLQRQEVIAQRSVGLATGCPVCYRRTRRPGNLREICADCDRAHRAEAARLIYDLFLCRELLGADCGGCVMRAMLCFFARGI
jgi:hypothetical protein